MPAACQGSVGSGGGVRAGEDHRVKVDPDFANVAARLADCVGARVGVGAGQEYIFDDEMMNDKKWN